MRKGVLFICIVVLCLVNMVESVSAGNCFIQEKSNNGQLLVLRDDLEVRIVEYKNGRYVCRFVYVKELQKVVCEAVEYELLGAQDYDTTVLGIIDMNTIKSPCMNKESYFYPRNSAILKNNCSNRFIQWRVLVNVAKTIKCYDYERLDMPLKKVLVAFNMAIGMNIPYI